GELKLLVIKLAEAVNDGASVCEICDCHSSDLEELYCDLFEDNDFKMELSFDGPLSELLYLDGVSLEPAYKQGDLLYQAIETAIAMFASNGVVVSYKSVLDIGPEGWQRLGFVAVPGTDLFVRDNFNRPATL